jgi:SAM-dependent methyltransferase
VGEEINLMDRYPSSRRPIEERGRAMSVRTSEKADEFGKEYFDGDRLTGYGGYHYHPRFWTDTVRRFRDHYELAPDASVLDIGCAKGFMMHDFKILMPDLSIRGIDVSQYAYDNAIDDMRSYIDIGNAKDLPYEDDSFDLVISINAIHNLGLDDCKESLREIERVARRHAFITVDAWHNEEERINLEKWKLYAVTYMHVDDWKALFDEVGYSGDYYWFIAE